jgi:hypothetical protein
VQGTPDAPRCGFSKRVVGILRALGEDFGSFDVLSDERVRQGIKRFSDWPTFPQLFVRQAAARPSAASALLSACSSRMPLPHGQEVKHTHACLRGLSTMSCACML